MEGNDHHGSTASWEFHADGEARENIRSRWGEESILEIECSSGLQGKGCLAMVHGFTI